MSCFVCEREAIDCLECMNKAGRERYEALVAREAVAKKKTDRFLSLLEQNYRQWFSDGDSAGYKTRNAEIWSKINAAGSEVFYLVQNGLDRDK